MIIVDVIDMCSVSYHGCQGMLVSVLFERYGNEFSVCTGHNAYDICVYK